MSAPVTQTKAPLVRAATLGFRLLSFPRGRKYPTDKEWPSSVPPLRDVFHGVRNYGVVTGCEIAPGRYLADVDVDWAAGGLVADALLPKTGACVGRPSKLISHLFYTTAQPVVSIEYRDLDNSMLLELRGTKQDGTLGKQTMIPPSVHPDGEELRWRDEDFGPDHVAADALRRGVLLSATAILIGKHWPPNGSRHELRLAYSRLLLEALRLPDADATRVLKAACEVGGSDADGVRDTADAVATTRRRLDAGQPATGARTVADLLPEGAEIVERLRDWHGVKASSRVLLVAADFLARAKQESAWVVPRIAPDGGIVMFHGRPRSMKSLAALSALLAAARGEAPWGVAEFLPARPIRCAYFSEEDGDAVVAARLRWLLAGLGASVPPDNLFLEARRGLTLDDRDSQERIRSAINEQEIEIAWFDTARAMAPGVDQGPAEAAASVRFMRALLAETAVRSVGLTHHDVKPSRDGADSRPRSEKASGGALLAAADCPLGFERIDERTTLVVPDRYKVGADPHPFRLQFESATSAGEQFRDWLRVSTTRSDERAERMSRVEASVMKVLEEAPDWINTKTIREAVDARGNDVVAVLAKLVESGAAELRTAARGAKEYRLPRQRGLGK